MAPQLAAAQERSYDPHDGLSYPVYEGPGSAQSRDLQAQVLQHAAGFKPDVSSWHFRFESSEISPSSIIFALFLQGVYQTEERLEFQIHGQKGPHSYRWGYDTGNG